MSSLARRNMDITKILETKIERKKFFTTIGAGFAGYFMLKSFPFKLLNKKKKKKERKITLEVNPLAVQRKKVGGKNV